MRISDWSSDVCSSDLIHRSNLVGMGVLPLQFMEGTSRHTLKLTGEETFDVTGVAGGLKPRMQLTLTIHRPAGKPGQIPVLCPLDPADEGEYYHNGGILTEVLPRLMQGG